MRVLHTDVPVYLVSCRHPCLNDRVQGRLDGAWVPDRQAVFIWWGLPIDQMRETFLHEFHHAMLRLHGIEPPEPHDENWIQKYSPALYAFLKANFSIEWPVWLRPRGRGRQKHVA